MAENDIPFIPDEPGGAPSARPSPLPPRVLIFLVQIFMFAMMAVTFVDVTGRYGLDAPIPGATDYIEFILGLLIFTSLPIICWHNEHITVSILDPVLRGRVKWVQKLAVLIFSAATVLFIADRMLSQANGMVEAETITFFLEAPIAPLVYIFSALAAISFLAILGLIWSHIREGAGQ